ncbi:PRD domain-containing protein [Enterococcus asini]|uniref:PRD domain-containing protein n=1 Tax=Enterococcus asini TaxID=57732 RepID=A0AAW8TW02_9ENTE|nr:PRD domain-containing protein [Enterococcus asini]MCD5028149.1 BglG family transcription antiterminator [Enterococcus asini]MDT2745308.1 PRD domain-containing protein [Enterococcus asini]MDT2785414.1 PRD domain-containing protein [Enterococcus asini]MDT2810178.1 PRD domain-containing protein [Enterococcus asini]
MITKKQEDIIAYLTKNQQRWVTANELADFCKCTTRTIRNQIAKINERNPQIISSSQGYRIKKDTENKRAFGNNDDRKAQLFVSLLKSTDAGVDLYELAEKMYVSESTLKNDIQVLRKEIKNKNLKITIKEERIHLEGTERDKRRYMISLLYEEGDYQEKLKFHIQDMIGEISLNDLEQTIHDVLAIHKIKINQYSMNNIVLHFAISIERIRQGNNLKVGNDFKLKENSIEYQLSKEITTILSKSYQIEFFSAEVKQLALLFIGLQNEYLANQKESSLTDFVELRFIETLKEVLMEVKETYLIDLQDDSFFNKLAIHLQSLYDRSQYEHFTRNSSLLDIKTAYPLTYDIAVYISMLLQEKLKIWFNEDEISFIALHIGAYLESKKESGPKLRVFVDINNYHDFEQMNIQNIRNRLGEDIEIINVNGHKFDIQENDVYLTSNREKATEIAGAVYVHPILTRKDLDKLQKRVVAKMKSNWRNQMFLLMDRFVIEDLYFNQFDPTNSTPESIRKKMFNKMLSEKYVGTNFFETVEKRELLSPTSFPSKIAVPHSVKQNAKKSAISIMTLQEPLHWDNYSVNMIALVAISQGEAKEFNDFFETFIEIVSDPINVQQLATTESFSEFILKMKMLVEVDE